MTSLLTGSRNIRLFVFLLILLQISCKKFVQVDPPTTSIASSTVYSSNASAAAAMTSVYSNMVSNPSYNLAAGQGSVSYLMGLASDELINYSKTTTNVEQFYEDAWTSNTSGTSNTYFWGELYQELYVCNAILSGLNNSAGVSSSIKQQITGEAKFMRAFLNLYATNLYGDIPLVSSTDYETNNTIHKSPISDVYRQIIGDLLDAQSKLSDNFLDASGNVSTLRVRPNKTAATALLARVYLYQQEWDSAETQANKVINSSNYVLINNPDSVFLANSKEAIWQFQSVYPGYNTFDAYYFVLTAAPGSGQFIVSLSPNLTSIFEAGDIRYGHWVGAYKQGATTYYFPNKYKSGTYSTTIPVTEYTMALRLAEQYLIRAEARAQQGNIGGAQADLNAIRSRAKLLNTTASDQASLLGAIYHERQVELFTEWGHRWFDLKRTGTLNSIMAAVTPQKGGTWNPNWAILPLPQSETLINPNLTQNPGYN